MTDASSPDDATNELIDALRDEILREDRSTSDDEPVIPDGLLALLAQAEVPAEVGLALDELLVEEDTMNGALHSRLVTRVRDEIERRASAPVYLEQIVRAARERNALTVDDLAARTSTTPETIEAIESAELGFGTLTEEVVAAWIDALDIELGSAAAALETSLLQPAGAYRGEEARRSKKDVKDFVEAVHRLVERSRNERTGPS